MDIHLINYKSLKTRLITILLTGIFFIILIQIIENEISSKRSSYSDAEKTAVDLASDYANKIMIELENSLNSAKTVAQVLSSVKNADDSPKFTREQVNSLLRNYLISNNNFVSIGTFWEPNAFDNNDEAYRNVKGYGNLGSFTSFWYTDGVGNFFSTPYTECYISDFYTIPKKNHKTIIIPPHNSYLKDEEDIVSTFVSPIIYHGKFYGVTTIDISTSSISRIIETANLYNGKAEISIISNDGTIVVSSLYKEWESLNIKDIFPDFESQLLDINRAETSIKMEDNQIEAWCPIIFKSFDLPWQIRIKFPIEIVENEDDLQNSIFFIFKLIFAILIVFAIIFFINKYLHPLELLKEKTDLLALGELSAEKISFSNSTSDLSNINENLNKVIGNLKRTAHFIDKIGEGKLNIEFQVFGKKDMLGNSLLKMRDELKSVKDAEIKRKAEEENRIWATQGLAKFNDILRQTSESLEDLAYKIINGLVSYLNANQGGLFLYNDENKEDLHIQLMASVAYDEKRYLQKRVNPGEGLLGTCMLEKKTVYLKKIPDNYIEITSGLGTANPNYLLIVPLLLNEEIFGIIEIASFKEFNSFEIDFVEKLAESISSTLSASRVNQRTLMLLKLSQQQAQEMSSQEEEMRQNLEELSAIQEELERKQDVLQTMANAIDATLIEAEYNIDANILKANHNYFIATGYSEEELVNNNLRIEIPNQDLNSFATIWNSISKGTPYRGELKKNKKDGRTYWLMSTFIPVYDKDDTVSKIFYIGYDISETKKLESRVKNQENEIKRLHIEINKLKESVNQDSF